MVLYDLGILFKHDWPLIIEDSFICVMRRPPTSLELSVNNFLVLINEKPVRLCGLLGHGQHRGDETMYNV